MAGELLVFVTHPGGHSASELARTLVSDGLAACVNVLPQVTSVFYWEGALQASSESLLLIKTNEASWPALSKRVKELHDYDVPEIIAVPILHGDRPYLDWLNACLAGQAQYD